MATLLTMVPPVKKKKKKKKLLKIAPPVKEDLSTKRKYENRSICSKIIDEQT